MSQFWEANASGEAMSESVSLTVSLTCPIPGGWQETIAIVPGPELAAQMQDEATKNKEIEQKDREEKKRQAAERQRKSEEKKRAAGLTKDWLPEELVELAVQLGWPEVLRRARRAPNSWWKFWGAKA